MSDASLSQSEIDALLAGSDEGSGGGDPGGGGGGGQLGSDDLANMLGGGGGEADSGGDGGQLGTDDLASMLGGGDAGGMGGMDSALSDAVAKELGPAPTPKARPTGGGGANLTPQDPMKQNLPLLMNVTMTLTVELGRTNMFVKDINSLGEGSIVELDKNAGEPVDIRVNGKFFGRGKIIVIDEFYAVEIIEFAKDRDSIFRGMG